MIVETLVPYTSENMGLGLGLHLISDLGLHIHSLTSQADNILLVRVSLQTYDLILDVLLE